MENRHGKQKKKNRDMVGQRAVANVKDPFGELLVRLSLADIARPSTQESRLTFSIRYHEQDWTRRRKGPGLGLEPRASDQRPASIRAQRGECRSTHKKIPTGGHHRPPSKPLVGTLVHWRWGLNE